MSSVPGSTAELLKRGGVLSRLGEDRLRRLLETTRAVPWEADAKSTQFVYVGPQAVELLGFPVEEWYKNDFWARQIHPDDRDYAVKTCLENTQTEQSYEFEYRMVKADGGIVWICDIVHVVRVDGEPHTLLGFLIDVTERKVVEQTLKQSEERMRRLINALPVLVSYVDRDERYVFENEAYERYFGHRVTGKFVKEVVGEAAYEAAREQIEAVLSGTPVRFDASIPAEAGKTRDLNIHFVPDFDADGQVKGYFVVAADVSEHVQREQALSNALTEIARMKKQLQAENIYLREEIRLEHDFEGIVGQSVSLRAALQKVESVADTDTTVLITGETGTGKELIARAIHSHSSRRNRPLVKVDCASLPPTLIESELFGREKGAFTGADRSQAGRFEIADGATIFLDEIGELPLEVQAKLLRVLEDGCFERLGSPRTISVDVRIIAATNRDLAEAVGDGRFRSDLFYRLNVYPIAVPPLRERAEDIPPLAEAFVTRFAQKLGKKIDSVPHQVMEALQSYFWPGNVRELQNVLERSVVISKSPVLELGAELLGVPVRQQAADWRRTLDDVEREHMNSVLRETRWKIEGEGGAASVLGLNPGTLRARLRKLGIQRPAAQ
jgi:PAS domain S-box-containing protein